MTCSVCVAAEFADEVTLQVMVRRLSSELNRISNKALVMEVELIEARQRISDLEHLEATVARLNAEKMRRRRPA